MGMYEEAIDVLNDLIQTCKDGENGFRDSAGATDRSDLKSLFLELSSQRQQFASELQSEVLRLGGSPDKSGSVAGAMHRGWINLKSAISNRNDDEVIAEAERGEDAAVESYEEALRKEMPLETAEIVRRQFLAVKSAHDRVRTAERQTERY